MPSSSCTLRFLAAGTLLVCVLAVRPSDTLDQTAPKEQVQKQSIVQFGEQQRNSSYHGEDYVCCAMEDSAGYVTKVFHVEAQREIKACKLTALAVNCRDSESCTKMCLLTFQGSLLYNQMSRERVKENQAVEMEKIEAEKQQCMETRDQIINDAKADKKKFEDTANVKYNEAKTKLDTLETERETKTKRKADLAKLIETLESELEALGPKIDTVNDELDGLKEEADKNLEKATQEYEEKETKADEDWKAKKADFDAQEEVLKSAADKFPVEGKSTNIPEPCQDKHDPSKSVQCCCSIVAGEAHRAVPMMVPTTFVDWDRCVKPTVYKGGWFSSCHTFQDDCSTCRKLLCGRGMCPSK